MRLLHQSIPLFVCIVLGSCASTQVPGDPPITSKVVTTVSGDLILEQVVFVEAPVEKVWAAYTTSDGWMAWAAPRAQVDLKVDGEILTAYEGEIGGESTNKLTILNYIPYKLLTLKADIGQNWPDILKQDGDKLANVISFRETDAGQTRIESYGVGYSNSPEYDSLMQFFIEANESLFRNLIQYLETGERVTWTQP